MKRSNPFFRLGARALELRHVVERIDMRSVLWRGQEAFVAIAWLLMLPFRLVAAFGRTAASVGRALIRGSLELCFALIGLAFVGFVGFALIRVIFHPLFVR